MSDKDWVIEDVRFAPVEAVYRVEVRAGTLPKHLKDTIIGRAAGRMADGRRFFTETPITREMWDEKGEEWCAAFLRDTAGPPAA